MRLNSTVKVSPYCYLSCQRRQRLSGNNVLLALAGLSEFLWTAQGISGSGNAFSQGHPLSIMPGVKECTLMKKMIFSYTAAVAGWKEEDSHVRTGINELLQHQKK